MSSIGNGSTLGQHIEYLLPNSMRGEKSRKVAGAITKYSGKGLDIQEILDRLRSEDHLDVSMGTVYNVARVLGIVYDDRRREHKNKSATPKNNLDSKPISTNLQSLGVAFLKTVDKEGLVDFDLQSVSDFLVSQGYLRKISGGYEITQSGRLYLGNAMNTQEQKRELPDGIILQYKGLHIEEMKRRIRDDYGLIVSNNPKKI